MATFSAKLVSVEPGRVEISAPVGANCLQQHGFGHAALTFGIGDSAAGYAALSVMPLETEVLTSEMKIHLLAPARGDMLHAIGRVIKTGKRLVIVQADVFACTGSDRSHIAFLTGTMIPVSATSKA
ncbi:PaaI family thioesterase [Shimia sp.]|uniref:PaaI family thioesterase n=1 Tax=Shimia sp. TaxID=1954381 RepID=UPI00329A48F7